jgi:hypothetical protein
MAFRNQEEFHFSLNNKVLVRSEDQSGLRS